MRIWVYVSSCNNSAQYDTFLCAVENSTTNTNFSFGKSYVGGSATLRFIRTNNGSDIASDYQGTTNKTDNVLVINIPNGIIDGHACLLSGTYGATFPNYYDLKINGITNSVAGVFNGEFIGLSSSWKLLIGAMRAGSGTDFSVTVSRIKVEFKL